MAETELKRDPRVNGLLVTLRTIRDKLENITDARDAAEKAIADYVDARPDAPAAKCVKCGHDGKTLSVYYNFYCREIVPKREGLRGEAAIRCGCKCEFSPVPAVEAGESRLWGELFLDADGTPHFICHTRDTGFAATKDAFVKFIGLLRSQLDRQTECPYYAPPSIPTDSIIIDCGGSWKLCVWYKTEDEAKAVLASLSADTSPIEVETEDEIGSTDASDAYYALQGKLPDAQTLEDGERMPPT